MKKLLNKVIKTLGLALTVVLAAFVLNSSTATAADDPYGPIFNLFTDSKDFMGYKVGNERDFLRIKQGANGTVDTVDACEGDVTMWFYIHNSQASFNNGDNYTGPGVAQNTRIRVAIPGDESKSHTITGFVGASNATTVSDTATITCNGAPTTLKYADSLMLQTDAPEGYTINGDITSAQGATIGIKNHQNNLFPGCWAHRVLLTFKINIKKKEQPIKGDGVCKASEIAILDNKTRKIRVTVSGSLSGQGASIVGYEINWGDGSTPSNKQTDDHAYAKDGKYTITAKVQVKLPNGSTKWVGSTDCTKTVEFKPGQPPVVPPAPPTTPPTVTPTPPNGKLVDAGPGSIFGIFAGTSVFGAIAHKLYSTRKLSKAIRW